MNFVLKLLGVIFLMILSALGVITGLLALIWKIPGVQGMVGEGLTTFFEEALYPEGTTKPRK